MVKIQIKLISRGMAVVAVAMVTKHDNVSDKLILEKVNCVLKLLEKQMDFVLEWPLKCLLFGNT